MRFGKPQVAARQVGGRRGVGSTRGGWKVSGIHRRDKPVSAARQRFNVAGSLDGVAERLAKARNRIVQAMVEIDKSVRGPNLRPKFLESHDITGALQQCRKYLEWLALQAQSDPTFAQLRRTNIQFKDVKANPSRA
jgi:hypothetical protein